MTDFILDFFREASNNSTPLMIIISIIMLIIGFIGLIKGADIFVESASQIAAKMQVPLIVIGLTIVAFGTSAPEAAISITSSVQGSAGIAVGNVVGSNIINILLILGVTALICKLPVKKNTFRFEMPFVIFITAVLLLLGFIGSDINRIDGFILIFLFVIFMVYLFKVASKTGDVGDDIPEIDKNASIPKMILLVIIGLAMVVIGSAFTVTGATEIAKTLGVSERVIGLTIVAFGTSLPELVTCIVAARKKKTDIAIGNIIGSNIFNILFVGGIAAAVSPQAIAFEPGFIIDTIVAIAAAVLLFLLCCNKKRSLGKAGGLIMIACYVGYGVYLFI